MDEEHAGRPLRYGWTTGSCATAAARAAFDALITGQFADPIEIVLPDGARTHFALACTEFGEGFARAGVIKDAGDDPDVTHGALVLATVRLAPRGSGVVFCAGAGVGTVTKPGLPLPPGEPAINPVPRAMMSANIAEVAQLHGCSADAIVEIAIPGGEALAQKTLNPRLGILGGLSILGTTGIVVPYSCAAWVHSIHRGVDVARAQGLTHIAGATGSVSEKAVQHFHDLPEDALIDMGDFVGGLLKYLRRRPIETLTIGGGFAKMAKLGQGMLDLHARRGAVDLDVLAEHAIAAGGDTRLAERIRAANTGLDALERAAAAGINLAESIADAAWRTAAKAVEGGANRLDIVVVDRTGHVIATTGFRALH
ncbi:cobalt-precorrin-5B (C(1))-methyltransferase [Methylovirgula sp. HY1]|uniref:cobalt-precorrin-5B (C(1))-methyltransferase n=1 Tax=Methylovirgula sp. HY1 TaxID=2822761 RepID=UPI001C5BA96F|nr:cobalt-precorrin-5B (C(1))-methyltransferase [Methylovirgula sp. HY1]QXX76229.1 Cobalt-precorrin-5B C(1)-methyltransferase [Methylovirgula sp. HY1]